MFLSQKSRVGDGYVNVLILIIVQYRHLSMHCIVSYKYIQFSILKNWRENKILKSLHWALLFKCSILRQWWFYPWTKMKFYFCFHFFNHVVLGINLRVFDMLGMSYILGTTLGTYMLGTTELHPVNVFLSKLNPEPLRSEQRFQPLLQLLACPALWS